MALTPACTSLHEAATRGSEREGGAGRGVAIKPSCHFPVPESRCYDTFSWSLQRQHAPSYFQLEIQTRFAPAKSVKILLSAAFSSKLGAGFAHLLTGNDLDKHEPGETQRLDPLTCRG